MATQSYDPADLGTLTRHKGDGGGIVMTIPVIFSLIGKIIRFQMRDHRKNLKLSKVSPSPIIVSGQTITIPLLDTDFTSIVAGTYKIEIQAEYTGGPTTLAFGKLTITEDGCYV
jgi:hypothetical protein